MKIQVINPNTSQAMTESIGVAARSMARAGTDIVSVVRRLVLRRSNRFTTSICVSLGSSTRSARTKRTKPMRTSSPATVTQVCLPHVK